MSNEHGFSVALSDICAGYPAMRPPKRVSVSEGAHENLVIKQPGSSGGNWNSSETPYMVEPMDMLASRRHEAVVFVGPARTGKCLDVDTPIATPSGWTRMGDLQDGDYVFGADGKPTRVIAAHAVKYGLRCYAVRFSDGSEVVSDEEHLWGVERFYWKEPNWRYEVRSTHELVNDLHYSARTNGRRRYRYRVRNAEPISCPDRPLWIDPYLLGVWLGNGSKTRGCISSHPSDVEHYEQCFATAGHSTHSTHSVADKSAVTTNIDHATQSGAPLFGRFTERLRYMGLLNNKHIPSDYQRASVAQRIALLQGLMDTDGYAGGAGRSACEFSTVVPALAEGFMELCRGLGLKPTCSEKTTTWVYKGERKHGHAFRITFTACNEVVPFRSPRKLKDFRKSSSDIGFRQIVSITEVASRPVRCIAVDNESKLFLAGKGMVPTHNTAGLLLGWLAHAIVNDPGDFCMIQMTKDKAREFSKTDVDRAIRNSPKVKAMQSPRSIDSNTFDSMFRHGMFLRIAWPTVSNVSGSTYRYVAITDIDRIENAENVDGEGPLFDLARKRTTTFMSRGMCLVESSPGHPIESANWVPATRHEAPPVKGILGIYNRSDRRRWYWQCPDCNEHFEAAPGMGLFNLPSEAELLESVRTMNVSKMASEWGSRIVCPHCGSLIPARHKTHMNAHGRWLAEGQIIDIHGNVIGEPPPATIAGYWLGGVAAAYQKWQSLVERYLQGLAEYAMTGSEETLKTTINTDQGMPYMSRHLAESAYRSKSVEESTNRDLIRRVAPEDTRCLLASVDVQGGTTSRFVVQIHAVGPHMEQWLVDRFELKHSMREGMGGDFAPLDPAAYPEDWDVLTEKLLRATWRTPEEGREIKLRRIIVDTGGEDGVTHNAYAWFRRLRAERMAHRVVLYKGASEPKAPVIKETMVGKRHAKSKPDVPLYVCNPNLLADAVDSGLRRGKAGPNFIHFPPPKHPTANPDGWLPQSFFDELKSEVRQANGTWKQIRKRNETFDLCKMIRALMLVMGLDKIKDWDVVPAWLAPLSLNSEVISAEERREMKDNERVASAAVDEPPPRTQDVRILQHRAKKIRRSVASPYLR